MIGTVRFTIQPGTELRWPQAAAYLPHKRAVALNAKPAADAVSEPPPSTPPIPRYRRRIKQNRERRRARYEAVRERLRRGLSQREIARQCGLSRKTVRRFLSAQGFSERKTRRGSSCVDPHRDYLEMRWQQG
jgi:AraC-like DNA-binding protein